MERGKNGSLVPSLAQKSDTATGFAGTKFVQNLPEFTDFVSLNRQLLSFCRVRSLHNRGIARASMRELTHMIIKILFSMRRIIDDSYSK
jgi:hypothetical protein